jgi:hypothetical protein
MLKSIQATVVQNLALALAFFLTIGCGSDNPNPGLSDASYFPLRVGNFQIFQVTETKITPYNVAELFEYQLKTSVVDSFINNSGSYTYIIHRYKRETSDDTWQSLDTWAARLDESEAVVSEANVPFVKVKFPAQADMEWNGNAYNNEESSEFCNGNDFTSCDVYTFGFLKKPFETSGGLNFNNTIEVIENNNPDIFTTHDVRKEIYAWQIGLVYREKTILKYCTNNGCYGKQMVEDGLVYKQELVAYGHE